MIDFVPLLFPLVPYKPTKESQKLIQIPKQIFQTIEFLVIWHLKFTFLLFVKKVMNGTGR